MAKQTGLTLCNKDMMAGPPKYKHCFYIKPGSAWLFFDSNVDVISRGGSKNRISDLYFFQREPGTLKILSKIILK